MITGHGQTSVRASPMTWSAKVAFRTTSKALCLSALCVLLQGEALSYLLTTSSDASLSSIVWSIRSAGSSAAAMVSAASVSARRGSRFHSGDQEPAEGSQNHPGMAQEGDRRERDYDDAADDRVPPPRDREDDRRKSSHFFFLLPSSPAAFFARSPQLPRGLRQAPIAA